MTPAPFSRSGFPVPGSLLYAELRQYLGWATLPLRHDLVAQVAEILHAHLAREEARRRHVAHPAEERDAMAEFGFRLRRPGDVVEDLTTLRIGRCEERLAGSEATRALAVQPREPAADVDLGWCRGEDRK